MVTDFQNQGLEKIKRSTCKYIIGVDEVGIGSLAGPAVVASAVVYRGWHHREVKDSKKFHGQKTRTAHEHRKHVVTHVLSIPYVPFHLIRFKDVDEVDRLGIGEAVDRATVEVAEIALELYPDSIIVMDGARIPRGLGKKNAVAFPKADVLVTAVSAASIFAKVARDKHMQKEALKYPAYDFENNAGYRSRIHTAALEEFGPTPIHRRSYKPVSSYNRTFSNRQRELGRIRSWRP